MEDLHQEIERQAKRELRYYTGICIILAVIMVTGFIISCCGGAPKPLHP